MHESGIVASLVARAETAVHDAGAAAARRVGVRVGALSGVDPDVIRTYWTRFATGSTAEAELDIELSDDVVADDALGVALAYIDVAG